MPSLGPSSASGTAPSGARGAPSRRTPLPCRVFTVEGVEVFITQTCTRCHRTKPLVAFGLRRMPDGKVRSISQCRKCRAAPRGGATA